MKKTKAQRKALKNEKRLVKLLYRAGWIEPDEESERFSIRHYWSKVDDRYIFNEYICWIEGGTDSHMAVAKDTVELIARQGSSSWSIKKKIACIKTLRTDRRDNKINKLLKLRLCKTLIVNSTEFY